VKKSLWIFLLAVLLPSLGLGWLALRSAEEQQIILERRTAELYQKETETAAAGVRAAIDEQRRGFNEVVNTLLAKSGAQKLKHEFAAVLPAAWPRKAVGFALSAEGLLLSPALPAAQTNPAWGQFLAGNNDFLIGNAPATVYAVSGDELNQSEVQRKMKSVPEQQSALGKSQAATLPPAPAPAEKRMTEDGMRPRKQAAGNVKQEAKESADVLARNVAPQRLPDEAGMQVVSQLVPATADFRALTASGTDGVIARFVQDKLEILFWLRPAAAPATIFGCRLEAESLRDLWPAALPAAYSAAPEFVLALLDDKARPVATQPPGETGRDWKRPFVASEIGEALPHWEAALYLMRPEQLQESARALRRNLALLIAAALAAITLGGWVVVADARRQLVLAQKKTDFVSNVSHELKTPLTSIRMFAELMQGGRPETMEKAPQYLRIIMVEAERLTRLINNVLDFAKLERRQKRIGREPLDLHAVIARTWEGLELHLRESGFTTKWEAAPPPYPVIGDEDALAQILVNLLSNAEKYSGNGCKEIELHTFLDGGHVCVSVLDRGSGVPPGEERKIFEAFYRAHDSLSSGIQGSGLGLTLAQRLAREQGGEIVYQSRKDGGSSFTLRLPLATEGGK
jgi:signal transduction histidine kinase